MVAALMATSVLTAACVAGPGDPLALPAADRMVFEATVQPALAERCANPGCHGRVDRPLEVYATYQHRLDPVDVHAGTPLTAEELDRNFERARAFLFGAATAEDALLLRKTIPRELGGVHHGGGVVFEDTWEPDYQALRDWARHAVAGGSAP